MVLQALLLSWPRGSRRHYHRTTTAAAFAPSTAATFLRNKQQKQRRDGAVASNHHLAATRLGYQSRVSNVGNVVHGEPVPQHDTATADFRERHGSSETTTFLPGPDNWGYVHHDDVVDPSTIEFVPTSDISQPVPMEAVCSVGGSSASADSLGCIYPFALMMQGSAPYIAAHAGQIAVFHIPGKLLEQDGADRLLSDIALARLLGMKIVLVVGCKYDAGACSIDMIRQPHEYHNALKVTNEDCLRSLEEEAGYLRTEVERRLNRFLRRHGSCSNDEGQGNVVSGNFYGAQRFGTIRGKDFKHTGYTANVHKDNIYSVLAKNDVVLLTTVGLSPLGDLVNVNGYHLAASVASSLGAYKLIYMACEGSVMRRKNEGSSSQQQQKHGPSSLVQEIPHSFTRAITEHHQVSVHSTGFATFQKAQDTHNAATVEHLLHLGWAAWAMEQGTGIGRAHVVNPTDGALLEELFTSKNGANTCIYRDEEVHKQQLSQHDENLFRAEWDAFFAEEAEQQQLQKFSSLGGDTLK